MKVEPYLFFGGNCEAALSFYQEKLGAELVFVQRFKDAPPEAGCGDAPPEGIMHASLKIGDTFMLASDGDGDAKPFGSVAMSLLVKDLAEGHRMFDALADGGTVVMPLQKTFWSEGFGTVTDRFGVPWMVNTISAR